MILIYKSKTSENMRSKAVETRALGVGEGETSEGLDGVLSGFDL